MSEAKHILVVGAGIAGSMLAYWLGKGGFQVTVIERSPHVSKYGQGIDLEGPGRRVVDKMEGVIEKIKAKVTVEQGFAVLDDDAKPIAAIKGGAASPTVRYKNWLTLRARCHAVYRDHAKRHVRDLYQCS